MKEVLDRNLINSPTIIYKITNLSNNKEYIGQFRQDKFKFNNYWGSGKYITRAIKKHGRKNFKKEIIIEGNFNQNLTDALEKHYVQLYNTLQPYGYNISKGGKGYSPQPVKIYQFEKDGTFIREWSSLKEIRKSYNSNCTSISNNLANHYATGLGYIWSYDSTCTQEKINAVKQTKLNRSIAKSKHKIFVYEKSKRLEFMGCGEVAKYINTTIDSIFSIKANSKKGRWYGDVYVSFTLLDTYPKKEGIFVFDNKWNEFNTLKEGAEFTGMSIGGFGAAMRRSGGFWNNNVFISNIKRDVLPEKPVRHKQDVFVKNVLNNEILQFKSIKDASVLSGVTPGQLGRLLKKENKVEKNEHIFSHNKNNIE